MNMQAIAVMGEGIQKILSKKERRKCYEKII